MRLMMSMTISTDPCAVEHDLDGRPGQYPTHLVVAVTVMNRAAAGLILRDDHLD
jgi:hypothetical protein